MMMITELKTEITLENDPIPAEKAAISSSRYLLNSRPAHTFKFFYSVVQSVYLLGEVTVFPTHKVLVREEINSAGC